jgi:hypothetical protein
MPDPHGQNWVVTPLNRILENPYSIPSSETVVMNEFLEYRSRGFESNPGMEFSLRFLCCPVLEGEMRLADVPSGQVSLPQGNFCNIGSLLPDRAVG